MASVYALIWDRKATACLDFVVDKRCSYQKYEKKKTNCKRLVSNKQSKFLFDQLEQPLITRTMLSDHSVVRPSLFNRIVWLIFNGQIKIDISSWNAQLPMNFSIYSSNRNGSRIMFDSWYTPLSYLLLSVTISTLVRTPKISVLTRPLKRSTFLCPQ